jgi:hypothetical protein
MSDTAKRAMEWLQSGDTGLSSKAICAYMLGGAAIAEHDYPRDPADLGRCLRLLEKVPEWKPRIPEMARFGAVWKGLAERWGDLDSSMREEVGINWEKGKSAARTYELMKQIRDEVETKDPRWVDLGGGAKMRM